MILKNKKKVKIIIFFKPNDAPIQDFREAPPEDE
jgi:hypothetical protein